MLQKVKKNANIYSDIQGKPLILFCILCVHAFKQSFRNHFFSLSSSIPIFSLFFLYFLLSPMFSREMVMNGEKIKNIKMDENKMLQTFKNFQSSFAYSLLGLRGHSKPIVAVCLITSENLEGHRPTVFVFRRVSRA